MMQALYLRVRRAFLARQFATRWSRRRDSARLARATAHAQKRPKGARTRPAAQKRAKTASRRFRPGGRTRPRAPRSPPLGHSSHRTPPLGIHNVFASSLRPSCSRCPGTRRAAPHRTSRSRSTNRTGATAASSGASTRPPACFPTSRRLLVPGFGFNPVFPSAPWSWYPGAGRVPFYTSIPLEQIGRFVW